MALRFLATQTSAERHDGDCVVVGAFSDKTFNAAGNAVDAASGGRLRALAERGDITGKTGATLLLRATDGRVETNPNAVAHCSCGESFSV